MRILSMWEMGGVHKAICQVPTMQEDEVLQQRMPEKRMGFPPPLVCCCNSIIHLLCRHHGTRVVQRRRQNDIQRGRAPRNSEHEFPNIIMSNIRTREHHPTATTSKGKRFILYITAYWGVSIIHQPIIFDTDTFAAKSAFLLCFFFVHLLTTNESNANHERTSNQPSIYFSVMRFSEIYLSIALGFGCDLVY